MAKDKSLLSHRVSDLFTEKTLEEVLRKATGENEVQVLGWDFGEASNKDDGYSSVVSRVKVNETASGKPAEISLVVKSTTSNLARKKTFRSDEFFCKKATCYTEADVFPKFQEFVKSKDAADFVVVLRRFAASSNGRDDYLALEDVTSCGFEPAARHHSLKLSDCGLTFKVLVRFHAVSFAYKDQMKQEFQRMPVF